MTIFRCGSLVNNKCSKLCRKGTCHGRPLVNYVTENSSQTIKYQYWFWPVPRRSLDKTDSLAITGFIGSVDKVRISWYGSSSHCKSICSHSLFSSESTWVVILSPDWVLSTTLSPVKNISDALPTSILSKRGAEEINVCMALISNEFSSLKAANRNSGNKKFWESYTTAALYYNVLVVRSVWQEENAFLSNV